MTEDYRNNTKKFEKRHDSRKMPQRDFSWMGIGVRNQDKDFMPNTIQMFLFIPAIHS